MLTYAISNQLFHRSNLLTAVSIPGTHVLRCGKNLACVCGVYMPVSV